MWLYTKAGNGNNPRKGNNMTGYKSKKAAALDEEGMYLVHHTQPTQEPRLDQGPDYERGFVDGMQKQMQSSVDKAVNRMAQRPWVGLTDEDVAEVERWVEFKEEGSGRIPTGKLVTYINNKLKEKNT